MPFHFDTIRAQLSETGDGILREREWLRESLADPAAFAAALLRNAAASSRSPSKSQLGLAFDIYHDAVGRHASGPDSGRAAFSFLTEDPAAPVQAISYAHLHAAAVVLSAKWREQGATAGQVLCIIYPFGPEFLLALCAALRIGLIVSVLPPLGADFLSTRLRALKPGQIVTARRYHGLLREFFGEPEIPIGEVLLAEAELLPNTAAVTRAAAEDLASGPSESRSSSYSYTPTEPMLALFSPQRDPCFIPSAVSASAVYLGALCDGLLLGLGHGDSVLAAPEHHLLQHQPTLLLMVLLHGGTFLHIPARALAPDPSAPPRLPAVDVLLLSAAVRDEVLRGPGRPLRGVRSWVCALPEALSTHLWQDFVRRTDLGTPPALCWHYDAASGGCLLFSLRQRGTPPLLVYPSPGRPFMLSDPRDDSQAARGPNGILRPLPGSCGILLVEHAGGYVYGGTRWPSRGGLSLAKSEVEMVAGELPFVDSSVLLPDPGDRGSSTLLVFIGPHMRDASRSLLTQIEHRVRDRLRNRLGAEFEPVNVQILAALPRRSEGRIDFDWCMNQYREGLLLKRSGDPVLSLIDKLIFACHRVSTPVGNLAMRARNMRR